MTENKIDWVKRRRYMEGISTLGLLLVCAAMVGPFASGLTGSVPDFYKWIYLAGAVIYTVARVAGSMDRSESLRLRRLRRLEFWAGICFCAGAFFWFYNADRLAEVIGAGPLAILRDTVLFTLAGAAIQVIASWAVAAREKKEAKGAAAVKDSLVTKDKKH